MNDILAVVWKHTDILNEKTAQGFSKWCGNKKLKLIQATAKRRLNEIQQKTSVRSLYVLKNKFFGKTYCIYFCWPIINASFRWCNRRHCWTLASVSSVYKKFQGRWIFCSRLREKIHQRKRWPNTRTFTWSNVQKPEREIACEQSFRQCFLQCRWRIINTGQGKKRRFVVTNRCRWWHAGWEK